MNRESEAVDSDGDEEIEAKETIELCIGRRACSVISPEITIMEDRMNEHDFSQFTEEDLEDWRRKVAMVETLLDEQINVSERRSVRWNYQREQGVGDRTIRNYLNRYRKKGPLALLPRHGGATARSPRIHDKRLGERVLALIEESPRRTVPQLRRIISREEELREAIGSISDRTIYRFLSEHELNQKQRAAKVTDGGRRSFHQFQASASMSMSPG